MGNRKPFEVLPQDSNIVTAVWEMNWMDGDTGGWRLLLWCLVQSRCLVCAEQMALMKNDNGLNQ